MTETGQIFLSCLAEEASQPVAVVEQESWRVLAAGVSCAKIGLHSGETVAEGSVLKRLLRCAADGVAVNGVTIEHGGRNWVVYISSCGEGQLLLQAGGTDVLEERKLKQNRAESNRRHDLRGLVGVMSSLAELLAEDSDIPQEKARLARSIQQSAVALVEQLDFERSLNLLEKDEYQLRQEPVTVQELLQQPLASMRMTINNSGVDVLVEGVPLIEARLMYMRCDIKYTEYLLQEVFKNAAESSGGNAVQIAVKQLTEGTERFVEVVVENKQLMTRTMQEQIFEKHCGDRDKRSGLGAYYARLAARAQGGDIWLDENCTDKTRIRIKLPQNI